MTRLAVPLKFAAFAVVMTVLTVCVFTVFSQFRGGPSSDYTAVFTDVSGLKPNASVRVAGVRVGTVDRVEGGRINLSKADSGEGRHRGHHHFIDLGLVAEVEGKKVRLSANAAVAVTLEEERSGKST